MTYLKNFISLSIVCSVLIGCNQDKHNIVGNIKGLENDTLFVDYAPVTEFGAAGAKKDTIITTNSSFTYDLPNQEPVMLLIYPKKGEYKRMNGHPYRPYQKYLLLISEPGKQVDVQGELRDYYLQYSAGGTEFNEEYSKVRDKYIEKVSDGVKLELKLDTLSSKNASKELITKLGRERMALDREASNSELKYLKNNFDKEIAGYFLARQRSDTVLKYYDSLSLETRNGMFKPILDRKMTNIVKRKNIENAAMKMKEGAPAPDFELKSIDGEIIKLESLNSEFIVLDFWGSWCNPCIKGIPKMKEYYSRYKENIEIVGIACRDTEKDWRNAVKKYDLDWVQVINSDNPESDITVKYGIQAYPTKLILDRNKNIVAKFTSESEEFYATLDSLMAE